MTDSNSLSNKFPCLSRDLGRVELASLPTPLRSVQITSSGRQHHLHIKCDNLTGSSYGGNKVRKLEYAFWPARAKDKSGIATFGAVGSNHALATALYASKIGLPCTCFLSHQASSEGITSTLMAHLELGTELVRYGGAYAKRMATLRQHLWDRNYWVIPAGGSSWRGVIGFVNAGLELAQQIGSGEIPPPDRLYIATGTMGSAAGLAIGLALAGLHCRIEAIRVSMTAICNEQKLALMIAKTAMMMRRIDPSIPLDLAQKTNIRLRDDFYAGGYAHSDAATDQAIEFGRDRLDLALEKTYTAKALAALLHDLPDAGDEHLLFWNTYNSAVLKRNLPEQAARESLPAEFLRYLGS